MRNTNRWLVFLLTVVMLVSALGVPAMAVENESPLTLTAPAEAAKGTTIQVKILADEAQTVADGKLVVTYDAAKLAYVGAAAGNAWSDAEVTLSVNPSAGKIILAFANAETAAADVLFDLQFIAFVPGTASVAIDGSSYLTGTEANLSSQCDITITEKIIASGWSGYTLWKLTSDGTLTVSPSGNLYEGKCNMKHYWKVNGVLTLPWTAYADQITRVVIEEGVDSIGQMAFYEMPSLQEVVLPESLSKIYGYAFKNDTALTAINLGHVTYVCEGAFYGCTSLEVVELPEGATVEDWAFSKVPGYRGAN